MTEISNNNNNVILFVLLHVSFGITYFLTAQKIMNFQLLSPSTMQVPGLVYLADVLSAVVTKWVVPGVGGGGSGKEKKKKTSAAKEEGRPWQFYALPVAEFVGLTLAIRAMETCGGPLYQTLAGMQIPMTVLFSSALLKKKYTVGQLMGVSVVICGLAVKASEVLGAEAGSAKSTTTTTTIPVVGVLCAFISGISYSMRGILMEYLSKSTKNPPSGDEMSFAMGTFGLAAFAAYTLLVTVPNKEEWVLKPMRKSLATNAVPAIVFFYVANACARAMMAKCMMKIVRSSGATALSLSNATRSVGVIVFTHVAFCSATAKKQCLSQTGAISAALVVSGGLIYAYQTSIAKSSGSGASAKSKKSNAKNAPAAKPTRSSARVVAAAAKSETIRKRR
jgi:drug/metabolite transporter (DMT)-like permease